MLVPGYGLSEKVAFATEAVGRPDVYEFDPTYGFAELIGDDDMPVQTPGQRGRIVGTGFISKGMPLIRYDSEDEATLVESASPANGYRLVVSDITSKHQAYLVTQEGSVISAASMTPNVESYGAVAEFQFFQARAGVAELRMVVDPKGTRERAEAFANEMRQYLGNGIRLESVFVDRIPPTTRGKRKMIDQTIPRTEIERALRDLVEA
jgi:phenylacetate-CoA ligase